MVQKALEYGKSQGSTEAEQIEATIDKLAVTFAQEILNIIPGRVSIELDARLSFDTEAMTKKALHLVQMCRGTLNERNSCQKET